MTFTEIVNNVADSLNLTSAAAITRIGANVNKTYRRLCSSLGIDTVQFVAGVAATTTIGNRSLTFSPSTTTPSVGVEKILAVYNTAFTPPNVLEEFLFDDLRNALVGTDPPQNYAVQNTGSNFVTIYLDSTPSTQYALTADVISNVTTLSGSLVPNIPEDFHELLELVPRGRELNKMEKYTEAKAEFMEFDERVKELRGYYARSAYLDIHQGKTNGTDVTLTTPLV